MSGLLHRLWTRLPARLRHRLRRRSDRAAPRTKTAAGRRGERYAVDYLGSRGYTVLERNYFVRGGEIDIIAFRDGVVAFVEVRSRSVDDSLDPAQTVTPVKQRRVVRAAEHWLAAHRRGAQAVATRFDIIAVRFGPPGTTPEIRHFEGAFQQTGHGSG